MSTRAVELRARAVALDGQLARVSLLAPAARRDSLRTSWPRDRPSSSGVRPGWSTTERLDPRRADRSRDDPAAGSVTRRIDHLAAAHRELLALDDDAGLAPERTTVLPTEDRPTGPPTPTRPSIAEHGSRTSLRLLLRRRVGPRRASRGAAGRGPLGNVTAMVNAFVLLKVQPARIAALASELTEIAGVSEVYSVAGDVDLVAIVRVRHHDELAEVVTGRLSALDGIVETRTMIAFQAFSQHDLDAMFSLGGD